MFQLLEGATPYREDESEEYLEHGWWSGLPFGDLLNLRKRGLCHQLSHIRMENQAIPLAVAVER